MSLYVSQKKSMFDEEIDILATGLDPERFYTLHLSLTHKNGIHEAYATFKPDQNGKIDLSTMAPISGTYLEAHKMGLFISMIASKTNRPAALVVLDPVDPPKIYNLELKDSGDKVLDKVILERYILHPDVERIEIETPEMTATLFRPKGQGPFPALIDMFGSSGGIKEHRAALFASHGFVTLCLPFFNYKNLPSTLADVNMEYFEYAIEFLCNLPYTTNNCGIIGRSFGSCLAMLCAQRYHKITCVINVNGSPSLEEFTTFKENGKLLPYFVPQNGYGIEHEEVVCEIDGKMAIAHNSFYKKVPENHWRLGPVENIPKNTGIYYIATLDDLGINSTETADYFYKRLKKSGHNNIVVDVKPGGHLIDAPYVPHMDFVWNKYFGIYMAYGGEPVSHCKAQEEYWPKILSFLSKNVREPPKMRKLFEIFCEKCHI